MTPSPAEPITCAAAAVRTDLAYVCARLRARFPRLLPAGTLEQLRGLRSLAELFAALLTTDYGTQLKELVLDVNDLGEWEAALTAAFARRVNQVRSLIEESLPAYTYLVDGEWDVHHLRALLRRLLSPGAVCAGVAGLSVRGAPDAVVRGSPDPALRRPKVST